MPYEWLRAPQGAQHELHVWPYRSLPRKGFVWFIGLSVGVVLLPLSAVIGTPVLWAVLPFLALTIGGVWWALEHSYRQGEVLEILRIEAERVTLAHHAPGQAPLTWQANPHWVRPHLDPTRDDYLTLRGGPREVELGACLTAQERQQIAREITSRLGAMRAP